MFAEGSDVPKVEVSGGAQFAKHLKTTEDGIDGDPYDIISDAFGVNVDAPNPKGWYGGATFNITPVFALEAEVSVFYSTFEADGLDVLEKSSYVFLGGPRIVPFRNDYSTVYLHALAGGGKANVKSNDFGTGVSEVAYSESLFSMAVGGGVEWNAGPYVSIRAPQIDYMPVRTSAEFFGQHASGWEHFLRIQVGVVFKIR
jgi:opacity protein-like surface antigen